MACFLLTWNPKLWEWKTLEDDLRMVDSGQGVEREWSVGRSKQIQTGDRVFLLKQAVEPRGVMASGRVIGPIEEKPHWDPARASNGDTANYVKVRFECILGPDEVLHLDKLTAGLLNRRRFQPMSSGVLLDQEEHKELERLWSKHLSDDSSDLPDELNQRIAYPEGAVKSILVNAYERSSEAREHCIAEHGTRCCVCDFSFAERYGEIGAGYIHVHHLTPLHQIGARMVDPTRDLCPVCPNCHAMLHRRTPPLTIKELQELLSPMSKPLQAESAECG